MSHLDPFSSSVYTDEDRESYRSWPEAARALLEYSWSMQHGVHDLLARAYGLDTTARSRLCCLVQNILIGRVNDLDALPGLVEQGTGLNSADSRHVAASIATTILVPFNDLVNRWDQDIRDLYFNW